MDFVLKFLIAYFMDLILGDPSFFYHPVRVIGNSITFIENRVYKFKSKKFFGGFLATVVILTTSIASYYISKTGQFLEIFFLYTTLATKSLGAEGIKVY
ncbi:MAG: cobalamin biosynthesis protein, partial [Cetobacterium sp.]